MGEMIAFFTGVTANCVLFWMISHPERWLARNSRGESPFRRSSVHDADLLVSGRGPFI